MSEFELQHYPKLEVGQALEICFERYGKIEGFVIEAIKPRSSGEYSLNNDVYIKVRKLEENDKFDETVRDGISIYKLKPTEIIEDDAL